MGFEMEAVRMHDVGGAAVSSGCERFELSLPQGILPKL